MSHHLVPYLLIAVPGEVEGSTSEQSLRNLRGKLDSVGAESWEFRIPKLRVGTLDSLISMSDELTKFDHTIFQTVVKIERAYYEFEGEGHQLAVGAGTIADYLRDFAWDLSKFPTSRSLAELAGLVTGHVMKLDEEQRALTSRFHDNKQMLMQLQRKRGGNLMIASLEDVLTDERLLQATGQTVDQHFVNTEFLRTVVVVIPRGGEKEWLECYEQLDNESVQVKGSRGESSSFTSPVVPRSARRIVDDKDGFVLYTVVVLVKFLDSFRTAAKSKRFVVRDYEPRTGAGAAGMSEAERLVTLENEDSKMRRNITVWCRTHFGEAYSAWIHIKAMRVFVESVLRYGVPPNYVSALVKVPKKGDRKVHSMLETMYRHLAGAGYAKGLGDDDDVTASAGIDVRDFHPYVSVNVEALLHA